jgi:hypothetical protein
LAVVPAAILAIAACSSSTEEDDVTQGDDAFTQAQVDGDPTLKALQTRANDVNQYEINVSDIAVPVPNASVGHSVNGFSTRGLDWFKNPAVTYPDNKSWDQGTDTGKKCQWAAIFRFNAIFSNPPAEATAMLNMPNGQWHGSFWSWIDDYASTNTVGTPTQSYAWSTGLWKWIGASGKDGLCRLPTKTMVAKMMAACKEKAEQNNGDPKGCQMPRFNAASEPAPAADAGAEASSSGSSGTSSGSTSGSSGTSSGSTSGSSGTSSGTSGSSSGTSSSSSSGGTSSGG